VENCTLYYEAFQLINDDSGDEPVITEEPEREPMVHKIPESDEPELYHLLLLGMLWKL